ncbi:MAG: hypothetical protein HY840_14090 [Bacteroidetes bacterium]|nr:hypothetical protein [Bacteroidota bacterium]
MEERGSEKYIADQYERLSHLIELMGLYSGDTSHFHSLHKYFWSKDIPDDILAIKEYLKDEDLFGDIEPVPLFDDVCFMLFLISQIHTDLKDFYKHKANDLEKLKFILNEEQKGKIKSSYGGQIIDSIYIKLKPSKERKNKSVKFKNEHTIKFFVENLVPKLKTEYENLIEANLDSRLGITASAFRYKATYALSILLEDKEFPAKSIPSFIVTLYEYIGILSEVKIEGDPDSLRTKVAQWIAYGKDIVSRK